MSIIYSRFGFRIEEVYFDEASLPSAKSVDLTRFSCVLRPKEEAIWKKWQTIVIDLTLKPDDLLKAMDSGTRYEIRRAENKDNLTTVFSKTVTSQQVQSLCDFYDSFAATKFLKPIFRPRIKALARAKCLLLSEVRQIDGEVLVQHVHVWNGKNAVLLYSSSKFRDLQESSSRALIGRANRFLHWKDMLFFKSNGVDTYDLGGIDQSQSDTEVARITQFKMSFGGEVRPRYTRNQSSSLLGYITLAFFRAFSWSF
ncbi:MAG: hypothetical protein C0412_01610 [Flavobacterium sp.]|nr:hypothetical protein [Flavobacterium sp.]